MTLRLEEELIDRARAYGARHDLTLSQLVSRFLAALPSSTEARVTPHVRELMEIAPSDADIAEYHRYLEEKYGH
ncbi:MAG TPA: DUF6364 family protein [Longimicrobiaceae bacterium]|nr:DUF6364 family protein [Longimicrobiaceae bacterium]